MRRFCFLMVLNVCSVASFSEGIPRCEKILNGRGEIAPGFRCCENGFGETKCLERKLADDTLYMMDRFSDLSRKQWAIKADLQDSILIADRAKKVISDSVQKRTADSISAQEEYAFQKECRKSINKPKRVQGGVYPKIRAYLLKVLKDPDSFKPDEWGEAEKAPDFSGYCYDVVVRYRAKNGFGGYEIYRQRFHLGLNGLIDDVVDDE